MAVFTPPRCGSQYVAADFEFVCDYQYLQPILKSTRKGVPNSSNGSHNHSYIVSRVTPQQGLVTMDRRRRYQDDHPIYICFSKVIAPVVSHLSNRRSNPHPIYAACLQGQQSRQIVSIFVAKAKSGFIGAFRRRLNVRSSDNPHDCTNTEPRTGSSELRMSTLTLPNSRDSSKQYYVLASSGMLVLTHKFFIRYFNTCNDSCFLLRLHSDDAAGD